MSTVPGSRQGLATGTARSAAAAATVPAAPGPATIRLTPIPVRVKVTSALTGVPLPAAIRTPDRTRVVASAAGAATVYRVGPGDRVTVTAAGYRPATVSVAANRTIRATLQPLAWKTAAAQILVWLKTKKYAALANWVFSPATGYQYYPGQPATSSGIVSVAFGLTPGSRNAPRAFVLVERPPAATAATSGRPVIESSTVPFTVMTGCAMVVDFVVDGLPDPRRVTSTTETAAISTSGTISTGRRYHRLVRRGGCADGGDPT